MDYRAIGCARTDAALQFGGRLVHWAGTIHVAPLRTLQLVADLALRDAAPGHLRAAGAPCGGADRNVDGRERGALVPRGHGGDVLSGAGDAVVDGAYAGRGAGGGAAGRARVQPAGGLARLGKSMMASLRKPRIRPSRTPSRFLRDEAWAQFRVHRTFPDLVEELVYSCLTGIAAQRLVQNGDTLQSGHGCRKPAQRRGVR